MSDTTDKLSALLVAATPGPWVVHDETVIWRAREVPVETTYDLIAPVAELRLRPSFYGDLYDDATMRANADLIAMAPDLAAEVIRLRAINTQLVADFNTMNQHGAKQDETIRELRLQLGMANHAEDATRAENAGMVKVSTELAAEAKRLMAQIAAADRLVQSAVRLVDVAVRISEVDNDNRMMDDVADTQADIAAYRAIRGGGNG